MKEISFRFQKNMLLLFLTFQYGHCYPDIINIADLDCLNTAKTTFKFLEEQLFNQTCYMCTNCILNDTVKCKVIVTPKIPAYNRILQGGISYDFEEMNATVNVTYSPTCVFQIRLYLLFNEPLVEFYICGKDGCDLQKDKSIQFETGKFLLFTLSLPDNHINSYVQVTPTHIELNDVEYNKNFTIECTDGKEMPYAEYILYYRPAKFTFNHYILLPCSPGGFLISKETGKFFDGDNLKLFTNSTDRDEIARKLGLDPNKTYPVPDLDSSLPVYISINGSFINEEDIKSVLDLSGNPNEAQNYPINLPAINPGGFGDYGNDYGTGNENDKNKKSGESGVKDASSPAKKKGTNFFVIFLAEIFLCFVKALKYKI